MSRTLLVLAGRLDANTGGLTTFISEVLPHLEQFGWRVLLHESGPQGPSDSALRSLRRLAARSAVWAHDLPGLVAAAQLGSLESAVATVHLLHSRYTYLPRVDTRDQRRITEATLLRRAATVTVLSTYMAREVARLSGRSALTIAPGSDPGVPSTRRMAREPLRLLFAGRLTPQKGADRLAAVVQGLSAVRRPVQMTVVGSGPQQGLIESAAAGSVGRTIYLGWVDRASVLALMRQSHATLSFSRHEPYGLAFKESLAMGTPVVGRVTGGMRSFCREGLNSVRLGSEYAGNAEAVVAAAERAAALDKLQVARSISPRSWLHVATDYHRLFVTRAARAA